jgi:hypothetical protein
MTRHYDSIDAIDDAFANEGADADSTSVIPAMDENAKLTYENHLLRTTNNALNEQYSILEQVANELVTDRDTARKSEIEAQQALINSYAPQTSKHWLSLGLMAGGAGLGLYALRTMDPIAVYSSMFIAGLGVGLGVKNQ